MNYLLDTHALIWWDSQPEKLSPIVLEALENTHNDLFISVVSLWEIQIKQQLGKLILNKPLETLIAEQQDVNGFSLLAIKPAHIFTLSELPDVHKDPFDRLLISQAKFERMTLVSRDTVFVDYPVEILW